MGSHTLVVEGEDTDRGKIVCSRGLEREKKKKNLEIQKRS
jgi:dethiobiotin synthetase